MPFVFTTSTFNWPAVAENAVPVLAVAPGTSLYTQLKQALDGGKKIMEYGGRYYQDDEKTSSASGTGDNDNSNDEDEPETNKTRKRVITYKIL